MSTHVTHPVRSDVPAPAGGPGTPAAAAAPTRWALAGLLAGLTGAGAIFASLQVTVSYEQETDWSTEKLLEEFNDQVPQILR